MATLEASATNKYVRTSAQKAKLSKYQFAGADGFQPSHLDIGK